MLRYLLKLVFVDSGAQEVGHYSLPRCLDLIACKSDLLVEFIRLHTLYDKMSKFVSCVCIQIVMIFSFNFSFEYF